MTTSAAKANRNADIVDKLEAEIERLRAALTQIADMPPLQSVNAGKPPTIYDAEQKIARAALAIARTP